MANEHNPSCPNRRAFLKNAAKVGAGVALCAPAVAGVLGHRRFEAHGAPAQEWKPKGKTPEGKFDLVVAKGENIEKMAESALEALGALDDFLAKGDNVLVKPNIGWDRAPEQAANTNPELVAHLVRMSLKAGAKSVTVLDNSCNDARKSYARSGIRAAAEHAGAKIVFLSDNDYVNVKLNGKKVKQWPLLKSYPEFDKVINVPIAKDHCLAKLTLGMKNYFGLIGGGRGELHQYLDDAIADLAKYFTELRPTLTVIDAYRILLRNGPVGGRLSDVEQARTLIAGYRQASADAYAATLFNLRGDRIGHIRAGDDRGLGSINLNGLKIKDIKV